MHYSKGILVTAAAITAMVVSAGPGMARGINGSAMNMVVRDTRSYSGNWPVTVTRSQFSDGTDCLTLTENGSNGGSASLLTGSRRLSNGTFLIIDHTLVATIEVEGLSGETAGLVFIGSADRGKIGPGVFEDVLGGADFDAGALAFAMKGGC